LTCNEIQHLFAALVFPASSFDGAVLAGWGTADPQALMPNELIGSREHNWLTGKALLTAVRLMPSVLEHYELVDKH